MTDREKLAELLKGFCRQYPPGSELSNEPCGYCLICEAAAALRQPPVSDAVDLSDYATAIGENENFRKRITELEVENEAWALGIKRLQHLNKELESNEVLRRVTDIAKDLKAENERLRDALREIAEFDMEQDCLPACDSYSHADLCPWTAAEYCMAKIARKALKEQT